MTTASTTRPSTTRPSTGGAIQVDRVAGNIGAEIRGVDLAGALDDGIVTRLLDELTRHKVLFFRDQHRVDDEGHVAFTARLGSLTAAHPTVPGLRSNARVLDVDGANGGRANSWHTDVTFVDHPPAASVLRAVVLPPFGGDTLWTNTEVAYRTLPDHLRRLADDLWAVHTNAYDYAEAQARTTAQKRRYVEVFTSTVYETVHPVVRVHARSAEPSLLLGTFARHLLDVAPQDSADLLRMLQAHIVQPEHTVRWRWRPGDVAIWDNQATQHYAIADYGDAPRNMHRVTIAGQVPVSLDGRRSRAVKGDSAAYLS